MGEVRSSQGNPVNFIDPTGTSFWSWFRGFFGPGNGDAMIVHPMEDLNDFLGRSNDYWNSGPQLQPDLPTNIGSYPLSVLNLAVVPSQSQLEALGAGITMAKEWLKNPDCAKIFGLSVDEAADLLAKLTINFEDFNQSPNKQLHNTVSVTNRGYHTTG